MSVDSLPGCLQGLSTYTVLRLGASPRCQVRFPGRHCLPEGGTLGYVRSPSRVALTATLGQVHDALPWRDYPKEVLTPVATLLKGQDRDHGQVLIGARNTLNEFGYRARIDGLWWGRRGDPPLPPDWPVLVLAPGGLSLEPLSKAEGSAADLVTGIPLVVGSKPKSRAFFLAHCSDVAHVFAAHPSGLIGPSRNTNPESRRAENQALWTELSQAWQEGLDRKLSEADVAQVMAEVGERRAAAPSRNLLHSMIAVDREGCVMSFALTGSLDGIAAHLARHWGVRDAVLLDNGGSVGWWSRSPGNEEAVLLVAGPNYRPQGTAFLDFRIDQFLQPLAHAALDDMAP